MGGFSPCYNDPGKCCSLWTFWSRSSQLPSGDKHGSALASSGKILKIYVLMFVGFRFCATHGLAVGTGPHRRRVQVDDPHKKLFYVPPQVSLPPAESGGQCLDTSNPTGAFHLAQYYQPNVAGHVGGAPASGEDQG